MSRAGAHIRSASELARAVPEAWAQCRRIEKEGCRVARRTEMAEAVKTQYLCFAHAVYLDAIRFAVESGVGSRGSAIVLDPGGRRVHDSLGPEWAAAPENEAFREKVQETEALPGGGARSRWVDRRPLPSPDAWFETAWARFRSGEVYDD
jgi:hypothetical protein